jgi:hypothetical protein
VDYNKEGVKLSPQHQSVMDLSVKTIQLYITLLEHIQFEWENLSGVNSQRRGEVGQYQGKAMGQQAIIQSSHSTEDLFRKFAQFERRDLQMLLEISKDAWKNGKKGTYLMPDGSVDYFQIDPDNWQLSDLGVFVTDATKEVEKMNNARELAHAMIQNGGSMSQALDMIEGESFSILKEKINKAEKQSQELMRAQSQAEQESIQKKDQMDAELREREIGVKEQDLMLRAEDNEKDRQLQRELKIMRSRTSPSLRTHRDRRP